MSRVRVGIVSWNTAKLLDACLTSLPEALDGLEADVVVVDNGSTDSSVEVAKRHPGVSVIENSENIGYAAAMNQALAGLGGDAAVPDILIALNPDTVLPRQGLTRLASRLEADPTLGLVVPKLVNVDGTTQHSVYRFPSPSVSIVAGVIPVRWQRGWLAKRWWLETGADHEQGSDVDWAIGAVHVLRASAVNSERPYSERWFMYVEDLDLCWVLSVGQWRRRLEPTVSVVHVGNAAGAQAWGGDRSARWLSATYDWYGLRRGPAAARLWAAVNVLAALVRIAGAFPLLVSRRPVEQWRRDLQRLLPLHLRAFALGPSWVGRSARNGLSRPVV